MWQLWGCSKCSCMHVCHCKNRRGDVDNQKLGNSAVHDDISVQRGAAQRAPKSHRHRRSACVMELMNAESGHSRHRMTRPTCTTMETTTACQKHCAVRDVWKHRFEYAPSIKHQATDASMSVAAFQCSRVGSRHDVLSKLRSGRCSTTETGPSTSGVSQGRKGRPWQCGLVL